MAICQGPCVRCHGRRAGLSSLHTPTFIALREPEYLPSETEPGLRRKDAALCALANVSRKLGDETDGRHFQTRLP
ncbi:hypothetical protein BBBOND_0306330 [Babesia bigemina]|uniref:Uncharacterized protein n=1 Tax=Babesia bigemina TaxID=5866 RepID=A0A061DCI1_BABBI|nr:hypothetical protein BBBOND_0306330 [Babesia bigemina]CDR96729.1 hypothetical protein BBBOND_0306330 [Babesia bigemina]|eukprot:XP_012768915.1 hypothetical protein BBBOND_0306330 [Babesia bigemina]